MKIFLSSILLIMCNLILLNSSTIAQVCPPLYPHVEGFIFPGFAYNHFSIGISGRRCRQRVEKSATITWNNFAASDFEKRNVVNLDFAHNKYFKNSTFYMQCWLRGQYLHLASKEPYRFKFIAGLGLGKTYSLSDKWTVRMELGYGRALSYKSTSTLRLASFQRDEVSDFRNQAMKVRISFSRRLWGFACNSPNRK